MLVGQRAWPCDTVAQDDPRYHIAIMRYGAPIWPRPATLGWYFADLRRKPAKVKGRRQGRERFAGKPCRCRVCDMVEARQRLQLEPYDAATDATLALGQLAETAFAFKFLTGPLRAYAGNFSK